MLEVLQPGKLKYWKSYALEILKTGYLTHTETLTCGNLKTLEVLLEI